MYENKNQTQNLSQNPEFQIEQIRPLLACVLALVLCFVIPIIVINLVMAWGDSPCLTQEITRFSIDMTLRTWLLVQAYVFIAVVSLVVIGILLACISPMVGAVFGGLATCVMIPVGIFNIAWTIIGAVMYWGQLYPAKTCHSGLNVYMWIILILGCFSICGTCINTCSPKNQN